MRSFSIGFVAPPTLSSRSKLGRIQIGDFSESFEASLEFWSTDTYVSHWKESIRRIVAGEAKSCLITSLTDPATSNFLIWWPIYREFDQVYFQNHVLMLGKLTKPFDLTRPVDSIPTRDVVSANNEHVSEWSIPVCDLLEFLAG
jgi:hypothetical protein